VEMVDDLSTLRSSLRTANEEEVPGLEIPAQGGSKICHIATTSVPQPTVADRAQIGAVASLTGSGGRLGRGREAGGGARLTRGRNRGGGGRHGHGRGRRGGGMLGRRRDGGRGDRGDVGGRGEGPACGPPGLARGGGLSDEEEVGDVAQRRRLPLLLGGAGLRARQGRRRRRGALGGAHRRGLDRVRGMGERWIRRAGREGRRRGERAEAERKPLRDGREGLQGKKVGEEG
jgi:hypothetical protein